MRALITGGAGFLGSVQLMRCLADGAARLKLAVGAEPGRSRLAPYRSRPILGRRDSPDRHGSAGAASDLASTWPA
jgi:nucleoside-diphosphate-sugar epimerase